MSKNTLQTTVDQTLYWGPRITCVVLGSYWSLGICYSYGIMAAIDRIAIRIISAQFGYIALGAMMPTIQWYSAMGVRLSCGALAGILYDGIEKIVKYVVSKLMVETKKSAVII